MRNILFVCSGNKDRSRTSEDLYSELHPNLNFDSAGTNQKVCFQLGTSFIDQDQVNWADEIYVMENKHKQFILNEFKGKVHEKITVLNIKDHYEYGDSKLKEILKDKLQF